MTTALVIGLALLAQNPDPPTAKAAEAAVLGLVSDRAAERDEALRTLEAMNEAAVPALEAAAKSGNLELKLRAARLLDDLEARKLERPTLVRLNYEDRPLPEVVESLIKDGLAIGLEPEGDPRFRGRRVTLKVPEPVPFWKAIDLLCGNGGLKVEDSAMGWNRRNFRGFPGNNAAGMRRRPIVGNELLLTADDGSAPPPRSDHGAFRVSLTGLRLNQSRTFTAGDVPETAVAAFSATLLVRSEPRMTIARADEVRLIEANDDLGQSLLPATAAPLNPQPAQFDAMSRGNVPLVMPLTYPETPGKAIALLRGTVRVQVVSRRPEPKIFSLKGAAGKSFALGESTLTVHSIQNSPDGKEAQIDVSLTNGASRVFSPPQYGSDARMGLRPPPSARGSVEFVDAMGQPCMGFDFGAMMAYGNVGSTVRTTISVPTSEGGGPPVECRFFGASWATIQVPFEFRGVPMP